MWAGLVISLLCAVSSAMKMEESIPEDKEAFLRRIQCELANPEDIFVKTVCDHTRGKGFSEKELSLSDLERDLRTLRGKGVPIELIVGMLGTKPQWASTINLEVKVVLDRSLTQEQKVLDTAARTLVKHSDYVKRRKATLGYSELKADYDRFFPPPHSQKGAKEGGQSAEEASIQAAELVAGEATPRGSFDWLSPWMVCGYALLLALLVSGAALLVRSGRSRGL